MCRTSVHVLRRVSADSALNCVHTVFGSMNESSTAASLCLYFYWKRRELCGTRSLQPLIVFSYRLCKVLAKRVLLPMITAVCNDRENGMKQIECYCWRVSSVRCGLSGKCTHNHAAHSQKLRKWSIFRWISMRHLIIEAICECQRPRGSHTFESHQFASAHTQLRIFILFAVWLCLSASRHFFAQFIVVHTHTHFHARENSDSIEPIPGVSTLNQSTLRPVDIIVQAIGRKFQVEGLSLVKFSVALTLC